MKQTYQVTGMTLKHDGQDYPEGAEIELDAASAECLQRWLKPISIQPETHREAKAANLPAADNGAEEAADSATRKGSKK
ncbi:hypothetical protein HZU77_013375 [Neisseriaceae bacterium TC5R-5]|nr:hypothetical protein [Neisseriaceae bacterium TC5R-5]